MCCIWQIQSPRLELDPNQDGMRDAPAGAPKPAQVDDGAHIGPGWDDKKERRLSQVLSSPVMRRLREQMMNMVRVLSRDSVWCSDCMHGILHMSLIR